MKRWVHSVSMLCSYLSIVWICTGQLVLRWRRRDTSPGGLCYVSLTGCSSFNVVWCSHAIHCTTQFNLLPAQWVHVKYPNPPRKKLYQPTHASNSSIVSVQKQSCIPGRTQSVYNPKRRISSFPMKKLPELCASMWNKHADCFNYTWFAISDYRGLTGVYMHRSIRELRPTTA